MGIHPTKSHQIGSIKKRDTNTAHDSRCARICRTLNTGDESELDKFIWPAKIYSLSRSVIQGCDFRLLLLMTNHGITQSNPRIPTKIKVNFHPKETHSMAIRGGATTDPNAAPVLKIPCAN